MTDDPTDRVDVYLDGELALAERAEFEARLGDHPELRVLVDDERALRTRLVSALVERPPVGVRARIAVALDRVDGAPVAPTGTAEPRGPLFNLAFAAAVLFLAGAVFISFGGDGSFGDGDDVGPPPAVTEDASVPLFRAHRERAEIVGTGFDRREVVAETFVGVEAPDLACLGWSFHCGVRGELPRDDDPIVWTRYVDVEERELSVVMTIGKEDPRVPMGKGEYLVRRDGDLTGVFWQEPSGMVCGVVAAVPERELRDIADLIRDLR